MLFILFFLILLGILRINQSYNNVSVKLFTLSTLSNLLAVFFLAAIPIVRPYTNVENIYNTLALFDLHIYVRNYIPLDILISLIGFSSALAAVFTLLYSTFSTQEHTKKIQTHYIGLLFVYPLLTLITANPVTYKWLCGLKWYGDTYNFLEINMIFDFLNSGLSWLGITIMLFSAFKLFQHYRLQSAVKIWKQNALYKFLLILPTLATYIIILSWSPRRLIDVSNSGYFQYVISPIEDITTLAVLFLYTLPLVIGYITFLVIELKKHFDAFNTMNTAITHGIHTASMSIKVFNHSVKNQLMSVIYEADYLKTRFAKDEDALYSLDLITKACNDSISTLKATTEQLKDIFIAPKATALDIPVLLAVSRIRNLPEHIKLEQQLPNNIPYAYIDERHMSEVLYNLLTNSIEAISSQPNGIIRISIESQGSSAVLTVEDNGPGIASEDLQDIFTPFVSTKASTTNWGLGLSYCYKVVHAHRGKIVADSVVGQGTSFKIMLPTI